MKSCRFAAVLAFVVFSATAFARNIYVDNSTGDDRFRGEALLVSGGQGPVRTLQKAVRIARAGDRIVVNPTGVPFHEEAIINGVGRPNPTADFPVVIEGNGASLDGLVPIDPIFARPLGDGLFQFETSLGPTHTSDILFVDGAPAPRGNWLPSLRTREFAPLNGWLCYRIPRNDFIDRHSFAVSRINVGLTIYRSNHWIVRNFTFRGCRLDGVRIHGPVEGLQFEHCRFLSNGRAGIAAYGLADAGVSDSESIGNGKAAVVGRNFARFGLVRVRTADSPVAIDADPTAAVRITPGDPLPPADPAARKTAPVPAAGEPPRKIKPPADE